MITISEEIELLKTQGKTGLEDVDMSFLKIGDIIVLTDFIIRKLPNGTSYCVCVTRGM